MKKSKAARLVCRIGLAIGSCGVFAAQAAGSASEILGVVTVPAVYAPPAAVSAGAGLSILLWAPLLLITLACVGWLLWLIVVDARRTGEVSDELQELVATRVELQKLREQLLCDFAGAPMSQG